MQGACGHVRPLASKKRSLKAKRSSAVSALVMAGPYRLNSTKAPWSVTMQRPSLSKASSSASENLSNVSVLLLLNAVPSSETG